MTIYLSLTNTAPKSKVRFHEAASLWLTKNIFNLANMVHRFYTDNFFQLTDNYRGKKEWTVHYTGQKSTLES